MDPIYLESGIDENLIGRQTKMSANDIKSLNKAYSCNGIDPTNGGGSYQVILYILPI
jgi:hypothetical protein